MSGIPDGAAYVARDPGDTSDPYDTMALVWIRAGDTLIYVLANGSFGTKPLGFISHGMGPEWVRLPSKRRG